MFRPNSTDRSAVTQRTRDTVPEAMKRIDGPKHECELCESRRRLHREYGMNVCATCDEVYLPDRRELL